MLSLVNLIKLLVFGQPLPELTREIIDRMNAEHAREHADCTQAEVLEFLRENGKVIVDFIGGLEDEDLDRFAHVGRLAVRTRQFLRHLGGHKR